VPASPILPSLVTISPGIEPSFLGGERDLWIEERLKDAGNQLWRQIDLSGGSTIQHLISDMATGDFDGDEHADLAGPEVMDSAEGSATACVLQDGPRWHTMAEWAESIEAIWTSRRVRGNFVQYGLSEIACRCLLRQQRN
jgi:hypothetical protein